MSLSTCLRPALIALALSGPASAHEFWIAPLDYTLTPGQDLVAELRVGEDFRGDTLGYIPQRFVRFDLIAVDEVLPLPGRMGDNPALNVSGLPEGLLTLIYVSVASQVTYDDPAVYARFLQTEGLEEIAARNAARGLDPVGMTEAFVRHAKALVASGAAAGTDRPAGLRLEIVAGLNPYRDDLSGGMPVSVLLDGAGHGGALLRVLQRLPDGSVIEDRHRTDSAGKTRITPRPGAEILASTVWMQELDAAAPGDPSWQSHWASLTFRARP